MARDEPNGAVGYVLRKFPVLSETFILNELLALEARGVRLHIFSLARPDDPRFHEDLPKLKARVSYVPSAADLPKLLRHHRRLSGFVKKNYRAALRYALARGRPKLLWRFLQSGYVASEARRLRLTHLHAHFANRPATVAFFASRMAGIPFSFTAHAMDIFKDHIRATALARKIEAARFVVAISRYNQEFLDKVTPQSRSKVVLLRNGIDLERFAGNGVPPLVPFTIVTVARLVEKKGLHVLIRACRHLADRNVPFRCWIVGKGRARPQLEALIKSLDLRGKVELLGPHTQLEVLERYRAAHLYVLPCVVGPDGNRDGLPVSIVEALACGLPVVSTPLTGIPEVVRHRHNGLLVPPEDPLALASAIEEIAADRSLHGKLRENARPSVAETFDRQQTAAELHRLLSRVEP